MKTFRSETRSMPATLIKYASLVSAVDVPLSSIHLRSLLAEIAREDLRSMSLDQFELTSKLEGYPFEHYLQDPAAELHFRIDRNNFNVSVADSTAWDCDVYLPDFNHRKGAEWHVIEGKRTLIFSADRYRTLYEVIAGFSTKQGLKCLLAVEQCYDQAFDLSPDQNGRNTYDRRRQNVFDQMQKGEMEIWLDEWDFQHI